MNPYLACGVDGPELGEDERRLLQELGPGAVVLFARNVESREQLLALSAELRSLPGPPLLSVDLEGGRVHRLRALLGPLPSAAQAAAGGVPACRALGEAAGSACAYFGLHLDLAPVLDVAWPGGWLEGEGRCWAADVAAVISFAGAFLQGLESYGVRGCLKHYPGLGTGRVDSHRELPLLEEQVREEERGFWALAHPHRGVMVAHALCPQLGEGIAPASLSPRLVARARSMPCGLVLADDLEMGALANWGAVPERAAAALAAGCDQVILGNGLDLRESLVAHVNRRAGEDPYLAARLQLGSQRVAAFRHGLAVRGVSWGEVERAAEKARRLAGGQP